MFDKTTGWYRLLDMHKTEICSIEEDEARQMIKNGYARTYSTRGNKVKGIVLLVPLSTVTGNGNRARALSINNYTGTRFIFRQKISTEKANFYCYRHKNMVPDEDNIIALLRMLRPPAYEAPTHILRRDRECQHATADGRGSSSTWDGSKRSPALSVVEKRPSTSQSKQPTVALAA